MIGKILGRYQGYLHTSFYLFATVVTLLWLTSLSAAQIILWALFSNLLVGYLVSGYLHRYCSHKSWQPSRLVELVSLGLTSVFVLTPPLAWASIHRQHHRYTDTDNDPHGNAHSITDNFMVFNKMPPVRMIPKWMIRDDAYMLCARWYWEIGIATGLIFYFLGMINIWLSIIAVAYVFQVTLNLFGHPSLKPTNNPLLSVLYSGELYHKYHHENPNNPRFGLIDAPYHFFIRFLNVRKD